MDVDSKALLHFVIILTVWILFPLLPAWGTYRITPAQELGLKGPFSGMTLRATGSFVAYVVIATLISTFTWPMGNFLVGKVAGEGTWTIRGRAILYDTDGREVAAVPDLRTAYVRVLPDPNVIDSALEIRIPFPRDRKPTVYIEVPNWGGAKISLNDPESYREDVLTRSIQLKNIVAIRQQPQRRLALGEQ